MRNDTLPLRKQDAYLDLNYQTLRLQRILHHSSRVSQQAWCLCSKYGLKSEAITLPRLVLQFLMLPGFPCLLNEFVAVSS